MSTIVLSYRRDDSKWIAGRIFDRLEGHYGKGNVFMDIDTIPVGLDFREHLQEWLESCDILLAVVGPRWLGTDEHGHRAIDDEADWVRIEIETALAKKIPVIPILIDRLRMPKATELPESLRAFAFRQAAEVDSGVDFRSHMERLIRSMDQYLQRRLAAATLPPAAPKEEAKLPIAPEPDPAAGTGTTQAPSSASVSLKEVFPEARASGPMAPSQAAAAERVPPREVLAIARSAASLWTAIAVLFLVSELLAFLSEGIDDRSNRLIFIILAALPSGSAALIATAVRIFAWLKSRSDKAGIGLAMLFVGIVLIVGVPTFFHSVPPPNRYVMTAAWPLVLFGGFGLILIAVAIVAHLISTENRSTYTKLCVGLGLTLLVLAWLDSDLATPNLSMTDWRMRSVVIFTCVFVGGMILLSAVVSLFIVKHSVKEVSRD